MTKMTVLYQNGRCYSYAYNSGHVGSTRSFWSYAITWSFQMALQYILAYGILSFLSKMSENNYFCSAITIILDNGHFLSAVIFTYDNGHFAINKDSVELISKN